MFHRNHDTDELGQVLRLGLCMNLHSKTRITSVDIAKLLNYCQYKLSIL